MFHRKTISDTSIALFWPINPTRDKRNNNWLWHTEKLSCAHVLIQVPSSYRLFYTMPYCIQMYLTLSWAVHRKVYESSVVNLHQSQHQQKNYIFMGIKDMSIWIIIRFHWKILSFIVLLSPLQHQQAHHTHTAQYTGMGTVYQHSETTQYYCSYMEL
jgi:hypothetical protein